MFTSIAKKFNKFPKFFKIPFSISLILIFISLSLISVYKLNLDNDFTGGSVLIAETVEHEPFSDQEVKDILKEKDISDYKLKFNQENKNITLELPFLEEAKHQEIKQAFEEKYPNFKETSFETIGSIIGSDTKKKAFWTISFALIGIVAYLAWAFRKIGKSDSGFQSWHYGLSAIITLGHDLVITLGIFAFLGEYFNVSVGTYFLIALLTILGYSVNDTIVVFDRLREQILTNHDNSLIKNMRESVKMSLKRSAYTSITTLLALVTLLFFGYENEEIKFFALALIIGIVFGTYSSLFFADPILYFLHREK